MAQGADARNCDVNMAVICGTLFTQNGRYGRAKPEQDPYLFAEADFQRPRLPHGETADQAAGALEGPWRLKS
jgi:hypothetical protein